MQLHQVRYFLALCEELNFTRAARRCGVSQPSLTNAIRELEGELGGDLFHRKPEVSVTALGKAIRPHLLSMAQEVENALLAARLMRSGMILDPARRSG
jgi:LysR family transcriptional regulator, hydrogen peroxide-inducible genes activator